MFVKESAFGKPLVDKVKIFKGRINDKVTKFLDPQCKIIIPEVIEFIPLGTIAWLLAISILYRNHADIDLDSDKLYLKSKSINRVLYDDLYGCHYLPLFNQMRENHPFPNELALKDFLKHLADIGIKEDKDCYKDFEGIDHWNFNFIRKDLLLKIINEHPVLAQCFAINGNNQNLAVLDSLMPKNDTTDDSIKDVFQSDLLSSIKSLNPLYHGTVHKKTSTAHKFILKIMCVMLKNGNKPDNITGESVKEFISEYIYGNPTLESISGLNEINDDFLHVDDTKILSANMRNRIGDYKRKVFQLTT